MRPVCGDARELPGTPLPSSSPAVDSQVTDTLRGGAGLGTLEKGLSELHGVELQVPLELKCHHGKMKAWKHRVFPLSQLSAGVGNNPPEEPGAAGGVCLT